MRDITIVYYTNNRERPSFEKRIQETIIACKGDLPVVSVSQKPIDFGHNVCVGDIGASAHNAWRQLQTGAKAAKTKFVCTAEADSLHPPEYFQFEPGKDDIFYVAGPLCVVFTQRGKNHSYYSKAPQESSIFIGREYLIWRIEEMLSGMPEWKTADDGTLNGSILAPKGHRIDFTMSIPVITFKTENNMHRKTPFSRSSGTRTLPYWGDSIELLRKYQ